MNHEGEKVLVVGRRLCVFRLFNCSSHIPRNLAPIAGGTEGRTSALAFRGDQLGHRMPCKIGVVGTYIDSKLGVRLPKGREDQRNAKNL